MALLTQAKATDECGRAVLVVYYETFVAMSITLVFWAIATYFASVIGFFVALSTHRIPVLWAVDRAWLTPFAMQRSRDVWHSNKRTQVIRTRRSPARGILER